jgi:hypothetical protein
LGSLEWLAALSLGLNLGADCLFSTEWRGRPRCYEAKIEIVPQRCKQAASAYNAEPEKENEFTGAGHENLHTVGSNFRLVEPVCPGFCAGYQGKDGDRADRTGGHRHESGRREGHQSGKARLGSHEEEGLESLDELLSSKFVWIDDSGVIAGRNEFVKYFANLDLTDYAMEDVRVTLFNPNVALVTYKVTEKGSFKGEQLPSKP